MLKLRSYMYHIICTKALPFRRLVQRQEICRIRMNSDTHRFRCDCRIHSTTINNILLVTSAEWTIATVLQVCKNYKLQVVIFIHQQIWVGVQSNLEIHALVRNSLVNVKTNGRKIAYWYSTFTRSPLFQISNYHYGFERCETVESMQFS
jgi:hypothetical protein